MNQPILKTDRLILRPYEISDAENVRLLAGDYEVAKTTLNIPHPYELGMAISWIKSHKKMWSDQSGLVYAVVEPNSVDIVGTVSLVEIDGFSAELGYWIGRSFWGKGYCTEAVAALIKFSVSSLGISRIYAEHLMGNSASGKVMLKNGLNPTGTITKPDRNNVLSRLEAYEARYT